MKILSLNVALPSEQRYGEREIFTGGAKRPVPRAYLRRTSFDGDAQADRKNHGGPEKAVCVYLADHYAHWEKLLGRRLEPGAFSENLTVSGAVETEVCIGDVFGAGGAVVKVSQPRQPCGKLAAKNGEKMLPKWAIEAGYTGFYMRVIREGVVSVGDEFESIVRHPDRISIASVNDIIYGRSRDPDLIERLAGMPEFAGRRKFAERLKRLREAGWHS